MTYYEQGFITKCAELGFDGRSLLKFAQSLSPYDLDDFPSSENQDLSLSSGIYGSPSSPSPKLSPAPAPAPAPEPAAAPAAPPAAGGNPWDGKTVIFNGKSRPMTENDWNRVQQAKAQAAQLRAAGRTSGHFMPDGKGGWTLQDETPAAATGAASASTTTTPAPAPVPAPAPASAPTPTPTPTPTPAPTTVTPPASAPAAQPTANSIYAGLSKEQQDAFRNWAQQDGQGKLVGAMFRGQDGKVDRAAMDKFLTENSKFITGTDEDRKNIIRQHFNSFTPEQQKAFRDSSEYKAYRQAATARMKASQQANQARQPEKPLPKGWAEWEDPRTGGKVRVQTGSAAAASGAIGRADAYARNAAQQGAQPATQTVRRTYTPRNVASFRRNMSVRPLTTTPINQFAGRRKV